MRKRVVVCPKCNKKMKIEDRVAKFRCPNCKEIYNMTFFKLVWIRFIGFFKGIKETLVDIKNSIKYKYSSMKSTYKYMSQMKKNMKKDPNWSNYHKEQKEMKEAEKPNKFRDFFKKR